MKMFYINELIKKERYEELIRRILSDFSAEVPISYGFTGIPKLQEIITLFKENYEKANPDIKDQFCIIFGIVYGECIRTELMGKWLDKTYNGALYIEFPKNTAASMFNPINCIASFFAGKTKCLFEIATLAKAMAENTDTLATCIKAERGN